MKQNSMFRIIFILIVTGLAIWYLYPSISFYSKNAEERKKILADEVKRKKLISMGLDLQGGMHLVLETRPTKEDKEKSQYDILDRAYEVLENRVNKLGLAEPSIQKQGDNRLIVQLPGVKEPEEVKKAIGKTAVLEFKLLEEIATRDKAIALIEREFAKGKGGATGTAGTDSANTDGTTTGDPFAGTDTADTKSVNNTTIDEVSRFSDLLLGGNGGIAVTAENFHIVDSIINSQEIKDALKRGGLRGVQILWGKDYEGPEGGLKSLSLYFLKERASLEGDILTDATWVPNGNNGTPSVSLTMNNKGAAAFSNVTGRNIGKQLAIVLDNTVYSAPVINDKITQGRAEISGSFTIDEAKRLSAVLAAGSFPTPMEILEERTIGPSLGADSVEKARLALMIGFGLVLIFMIVYYKGAGVIANIALFLNLVLLLAIMASLHAVLTLPGIAGLILIIGMSIDANVIIFERIREELDMGKTVRSAVEAGYARAFITIIDANVTTLFTALILYYIGTGPLRGFAVTMIIGLMVSLFTALFVTKTLFGLMLSGKKTVTKLSI